MNQKLSLIGSFILAIVSTLAERSVAAGIQDIEVTKPQLFHTNLGGGGLIEGACVKLTDEAFALVKTSGGTSVPVPLELFETSEQQAICKHFKVEHPTQPTAEKGTDRSEQHPWHSIRGGILCYGKIVSVQGDTIHIVDIDRKLFRVPVYMLAQGARAQAQKDIAKLDPKMVTSSRKKGKGNAASSNRTNGKGKSGATTDDKAQPSIPLAESNSSLPPGLQNAIGNMKPPRVDPDTGTGKPETDKDSTPLGNIRKWFDSKGETIAIGKFRRRTDLSKVTIVDEKGEELTIDYRSLSNEHQIYVKSVEAGARIDIAADSAAIKREIPAQKLRTWKMNGGLPIATGEFVEMREGKVVIFEANQQTKDIPFDLLSDADKQYAKAMASGAGPGKAPPGAVVIASESAKIVPTLDGKSLLLVDNNELKLLSADGKTLLATHAIPMPATQIAERDEYYVLSSGNALVLLDKETFEVIGNHELWKFQKINDFALHPKRKVTYLSVTNSADEIRQNEDERNRVVMVDENTGKVIDLGSIYANWVLLSPNGESLFAGYKDVETRFGGIHVNPDGNVIETPKWSNTDILRRYRVKNSELELDEEFPNAGANGQGLVLSPNGKQIAYLSFTGYPTLSYNIALLDHKNFKKKPVTLATKETASCKQLAIHPTKLIAASPGGEAVVFFDTRTGKSLTSQPKIAEELRGCAIHQLIFADQGKWLIVQASKGGGERFVASIEIHDEAAHSAQATSIDNSEATEEAATKRNWTDKTGTFQVEAEFVGIKGDNVMLKKNDGKVIAVPLLKLAPKDQVFARKLAADME